MRWRKDILEKDYDKRGKWHGKEEKSKRVVAGGHWRDDAAHLGAVVIAGDLLAGAKRHSTRVVVRAVRTGAGGAIFAHAHSQGGPFHRVCRAGLRMVALSAPPLRETRLLDVAERVAGGAGR